MAIQVRVARVTGQLFAPTASISAADIVAGDLVLLHYRSFNSDPITLPAGFAPVPGAAIPKATSGIEIFFKAATASEPANYDVGLADGSARLGLIALYSDTAGSGLRFDAVSTRENASSTTITWNGVTTTVADTLAVCFASTGNPATQTPQTGFTSRYGDGSTFSTYCMTGAIASAGATGTRTATNGTSQFSNAVMLALAEVVSELRVTQAGAYAELESNELRVTQTGVYAEIIQNELRVTQAGVYLELMLPTGTVFRRPRLVEPLEFHLFLLNPVSVVTAQVSMASVTYPLDTVFIDTVAGDLADLRTGMTVAFGSAAGGWDRGISYIRKVPQVMGADALIFVGLSSQGRRLGEVDIEDNTHVTVYDDYRLWAKQQVMIPNMAGGVDIYKDSDIPVWRFVGGGAAWTDQPPPVANGGPGWASRIDPATGNARVQFDASLSVAIADGASISSRSWTIGDGVLVTGLVTDNVILVDFPAGFRWVHLFVTDSNGRTHEAHIPVLADDPAATLCIAQWQFARHSASLDGQEVAVRVMQDIPAGTYPDGTLAMIWQEPIVSNAQRAHMRFIGWHDGDDGRSSALREGIRRETVVQLADIAARLRAIRGPSQEIEHAPDGSDTWLQMQNANINKYIHYLLHWHSTALALADFRLFSVPSAYTFLALGSAEDDLWSQVKQVGASLAPDYLLTCSPQGELYLLRDQMLIPQHERNYDAVQHNLTAEYWQDIAFTRRPAPRVRNVYGGAILVGYTTPLSTVFTRAPGDTSGQGQSDVRLENQLALNQTVLNVAEGHRYALLNAPESEYRITLARDTDNDGRALWFNPALVNTLVVLTIPAAAAAQRGIAFAEANGRVLEAIHTYRYTRAGVSRQTELVWQRERLGVPAVPYTLDVPMGWTPEIWLRGGISGAGVVAVYEPRRAANLAASYVNLHNPGTNDAAPGVAPTFSGGWVFAGAQHLVTGVVPAEGYVLIVAFEDATGASVHTVAGSVTGAGSALYLTPRDNGDGGARRYGIGNAVVSVAAGGELSAGIMGIDGSRAWLNYARESDTAGTWTSVSSHGIAIGARNNGGTIDQHYTGKVTHAYIYNAPLTAYQMYAVMLGIEQDLEAA